MAIFCRVFYYRFVFRCSSFINFQASMAYSAKNLWRGMWLDHLLPFIFIERGHCQQNIIFIFSISVVSIHHQTLPSNLNESHSRTSPSPFLVYFYTAVPFALLNIAVFEKEVYNYQIILGCC